ncbi:MAG TPA: STAS domain-containing protein [Kiritimatiellia bacterium]|nr:STAS domain-containing protein [Kiritimatiellia bacterium]
MNALPIQSGDRALVAISGDTAFVKVEGRGSFKISSSLKQFGEDAIEQGVHVLHMDMLGCIGMDSTFMGVIAGLSTRMKRAGRGPVIMMNLSPRTRGLLATLGLDQVVEAREASASAEGGATGPGVAMKPLEAMAGSQTEATRTILDAHENLVALHPDNAPRFKDVLTYLREDLNRKESDRS